MSVSNKVKQLHQIVNTDVPNDLTQISHSLKSINKLTAPQIQSNQTYLKDSFDSIIPSLVQSTLLAAPSATSNQLNQVSKQIKNFRQKYSQIIKPTWKKQLSQIIQKVELRKNQKIIQRENTTQDQIRKSLNINNLINKPQQILDIEFQRKKHQSKILTIQQQIQPIRSIVAKSTNSIGVSQKLPQSIKLLNDFAISQGYMDMGSTTEAGGRAYLGRYAVKEGQNQYIFPYPKNQITSGQTPDLLNNYKYYAGNTINNWNSFVNAQNKFVEYAKKISTRQSRKKFIQDQIAGMNISTFICQALSTLVYYYIMIPLQNFVKFNFQRYDGTKNSFQDNYSAGQKVSRNPFLINSQKGKTLMNILITNTQPLIVWGLVDSFLKKNQNPINKTKIQQFRTYTLKKQSQAKSYFSNLGLDQQQVTKALQNPNIVGLKFKKFILPATFTNLQIVQIIDKVTKKQNQKIKKWQLNWGSDKMMCHDYVWQYKL